MRSEIRASFTDKSRREKFYFNNAKYVARSDPLSLSLSVPFLSFVSRIDLICVSFLTAIDPREPPRRKSIRKKNLCEVHFSQLDRTAGDTGVRISFPSRGCLTSRNPRALNRRRDPDILSASSLTCRYRYRICSATRPRERRNEKSIL